MPDDEKSTGLPALPTWPLVYIFVMATFILWIVLLLALSRAFT